MSQPLDLSTDWHTHTTTSDGANTIAEMVAAATERGVARLHLTDHVRRDTTWLPDYVREVERVRSQAPIEIVCGIEAKLLDVRGRLDAPADRRGIEQVVIADHQFPTRFGPVTPAEMRRRIDAAEVRVSDVIEDLCVSTSRAVFAADGVVVGHLFSVLPKAGIDVGEVPTEMLDLIARAVRDAGAVVEVSEKWRTPSLDMVGELCARGVELVPASDAHTADAIARWDHVLAAARRIVP
ncbi:MAG: PHP domain-containing protein [Desertimonas sp.]